MATAAQRIGFNKLVTAGGNGLVSFATSVSGDATIMPVEVCFLLHLNAGSTYAQGSTYVLGQIANSEPALIG